MAKEFIQEKIAGKFLEIAYKWPWFVKAREERARLLIEASGVNMAAGETLLEIGTGKGDMYKMLSQDLNGKIYSLDIVDQVVSPNRTIKGRRMVADGLCSPFSDGDSETGFDTVLVCLMLHHLPEIKIPEMITEALRVTKKGGRVVIIEDDVDKPLLGSRRVKDQYVRVMDTILNIGVPGGGEVGQKTEEGWNEIFNKAGRCQIKKICSQDLPVFGLLPWRVNVFELIKGYDSK